ncbi:MAG: hypothetical protein QM749_20250 [Aquabacterium sp.]
MTDSFIRYQSSNDSESVWVFEGGGTPDMPCAQKQYLIDLSKKPVQILAFGVRGACSKFHWASWGKHKSVIALKRNVKFTYKDGVLTPPKRDDNLFVNIEVYAGDATSINVGKIAPFGDFRIERK